MPPRGEIPAEVLNELAADEDTVVPTHPNPVEPGKIGADIKPYLLALTDMYATGPMQVRIKALVQWFRPEDLEQYIVMCMEYAVEKTMKKRS